MLSEDAGPDRLESGNIPRLSGDHHATTIGFKLPIGLPRCFRHDVDFDGGAAAARLISFTPSATRSNAL